MDATRFHCSVCNIFIQGARNIMCHIQTKEHKANFNNSRDNINNIDSNSQKSCKERIVSNQIDKEGVPIQCGFPKPAADLVLPNYPRYGMNNNVENNSRDARMRRPFGILSMITEEPSTYQNLMKNEEAKTLDCPKINVVKRKCEPLSNNEMLQYMDNCNSNNKENTRESEVNKPSKLSLTETTNLVDQPYNTKIFPDFNIETFNCNFPLGFKQTNNLNENQKSDKFNILHNNKFIEKKNNNMHFDRNTKTLGNNEQTITSSPIKYSLIDKSVDNAQDESDTKKDDIKSDLLPKFLQTNKPDHGSQTIVNDIDSQNNFVSKILVETQSEVETNDTLCSEKNDFNNDMLFSSIEQCQTTKIKTDNNFTKNAVRNNDIDTIVEILYEPLYINDDVYNDKFKGLLVIRKQLDQLSSSTFFKFCSLLGKSETYSFEKHPWLSFVEISQLIEKLYGNNLVEVKIIYPKQKKKSKNKQDLKNQCHTSRLDQKYIGEKFDLHGEPGKVEGLPMVDVDKTIESSIFQVPDSHSCICSTENFYPKEGLFQYSTKKSNNETECEMYNENISCANTKNTTKDYVVTSKNMVYVENNNEDQPMLLQDLSHKYVANILKEYTETKDFAYVTMPNQTYLVLQFQQLFTQKVEQFLIESGGQCIPLLDQLHILQQCQRHIVTVIDQYVAHQLVDNGNPSNFSVNPVHNLDQNMSMFEAPMQNRLLSGNFHVNSESSITMPHNAAYVQPEISENSSGKEMQRKILTCKKRNPEKPDAQSKQNYFYNQPNQLSSDVNKHLGISTKPKILRNSSSSESLSKSIETQNMSWADVANLPQVNKDVKGMKRNRIEHMPIKGILKVKGGFVMNERVMIDTYSYNAVVKTPQEGMRCLLCDEAVKIHVTNHLMETRHITNTADHPYLDKYGLHLVRIVDVFSSQFYHCGLCNTIFAKERELQAHIDTIGHINKIRVAENNAETALKDKSNIKVIPTRKARKLRP